MFLRLLVGMLRSINGLEVVANATTAAAGIRACRELLPGLLILDLGQPDQDGISVAKALAAVNPRARVIVLSAAASGFVCDPALDPMLPPVVGKIDACETLAMEIAELLGPSPEASARLTGREEQVLLLIGQGLPKRRIAEQLGLSVHTVDTHRCNICLKLSIQGLRWYARPPCRAWVNSAAATPWRSMPPRPAAPSVVGTTISCGWCPMCGRSNAPSPGPCIACPTGDPTRWLRGGGWCSRTPPIPPTAAPRWWPSAPSWRGLEVGG